MYKIKLPNFEGPFDLLLYFIKRDELNIYDIPIAKITEEYLKYIRLMKYLDIELAGEFLVMVATLMYIKLQMLLPKNIDEETGEVEDPRTALVQRLIEYTQYKEASKEFKEMSESQRYVYYKSLFENNDNAVDEEDVYYENSTLFDLLRAFKQVIDKADKEIKEHVVNINPVTIEEKSEYIISKLKVQKRIKFFELVQGESKSNLIMLFLALLELIKKSIIMIKQDKLFEDIIISEKLSDVLV